MFTGSRGAHLLTTDVDLACLHDESHREAVCTAVENHCTGIKLDHGVIKDRKHLSRMVFSVNQHTRRVAMPFSLSDAEYETVSIPSVTASASFLKDAASVLS
jgi:DNA primase catalytic subunit